MERRVGQDLLVCVALRTGLGRERRGGRPRVAGDQASGAFAEQSGFACQREILFRGLFHTERFPDTSWVSQIQRHSDPDSPVSAQTL